MNHLLQITPVLFLLMLAFLSTQRKQMLSALLILEMIMIVMMFFTMMVMSKTLLEMFSIMVLLTFAATETSLGLATLVMMMRSYGTDTLSLLSPLKC